MITPLQSKALSDHYFNSFEMCRRYTFFAFQPWPYPFRTVTIQIDWRADVFNASILDQTNCVNVSLHFRGKRRLVKQHLLPPRIFMMRLPLRTVQPRKAWAAVTESTVCTPVHILGQRPAHRVQFNLKHQKHSLTLIVGVSSVRGKAVTKIPWHPQDRGTYT